MASQTDPGASGPVGYPGTEATISALVMGRLEREGLHLSDRAYIGR